MKKVGCVFVVVSMLALILLAYYAGPYLTLMQAASGSRRDVSTPVVILPTPEPTASTITLSAKELQEFIAQQQTHDLRAMDRIVSVAQSADEWQGKGMIGMGLAQMALPCGAGAMVGLVALALVFGGRRGP